MNNKGTKIAILGAGNVGATIAYTLTISGMASEIVLIDINRDKAKGEAMDIIQGTVFCPPTDIYAGDYSAAKDANIVIVTLGLARKPGQTRLDLAQANVNIIRDVMPQIAKYAPHANYVVVSNPVDILTYAILKVTDLKPAQVMGSGTMLDTSRLRSNLAAHVGLGPRNVHAYVLGEHGDSAVFPWSLASIGGLRMTEYCTLICEKHNQCGKGDLSALEEDVRTSGSKIIGYKGATYYAIALSVRHMCECLLRESKSLLTVSSLLVGEYGIEDVCLSIPFIVNSQGVLGSIPSPLTETEHAALLNSAASLKNVISQITI
ncbi:MAG: L-lactate dehydrogenase [Clostridiales bacterium]|nr:L-lactate dehydrogenase [Clostridiales bacterium]